ncbi:hypothetical protein U1Q18_047791 [Sarracenia purpurea var. burkii]
MDGGRERRRRRHELGVIGGSRGKRQSSLTWIIVGGYYPSHSRGNGRPRRGAVGLTKVVECGGAQAEQAAASGNRRGSNAQARQSQHTAAAHREAERRQAPAMQGDGGAGDRRAGSRVRGGGGLATVGSQSAAAATVERQRQKPCFYAFIIRDPEILMRILVRCYAYRDSFI